MGILSLGVRVLCNELKEPLFIRIELRGVERFASEVFSLLEK